MHPEMDGREIKKGISEKEGKQGRKQDNTIKEIRLRINCAGSYTYLCQSKNIAI